jgi:hypothetical protein
MAKTTKSPREQIKSKKVWAKKSISLLDHAWYEKAYQRFSIVLRKPQDEPSLPTQIIRKGRSNNF